MLAEAQAAQAGADAFLMKPASGERLLATINRLLAGLGLGPSQAELLSQADLPLTAAEFTMIVIGAGALGLIFGAFRFHLAVGLALGAFAAYLPIFYARYRRKQRQKAFTEQVPQLLTLLVGALRSGYGLTQSIELVIDQIGDPASTELERVMRTVDLGFPIHQALRQMADRIGTDEADMVVTAINVQYETGGNLAQTLEIIGETVRDRLRIQREIRVLTAQQRITGYILAVALIWMAFAPARPVRQVQSRLDSYLDRQTYFETVEISRPFAVRVLLPLLRRLLSILGGFAPKRNLEKIHEMLLQAGEPLGLTVLDFFGLRLLTALILGVGGVLYFGRSLSSQMALRNGLLFAGVGFFLPLFWLRAKAKRRRQAILRALPDALDMLTISVEAGLAFESALAQVGQKWQNPLTEAFRRVAAEMRVGTPRDVALQRMAERSGVEELRTFVSVLIQSNQLGVSIAQVLHSQAAEMRTKRRQMAEEQARQASVKMVFPLVFLIFPALFIVILGPSIPIFLFWMERLTSGN